MQQAVEYRRKGLISGGVLLELLISTQLGFVVMLASMLLGLSVWVNVLLLVGTITAVLHVCSAEIHYRVDADGLTRFIEPRVLKSKQLRRLTHIDWSRIESYTVDHDRNRSWQAYPYLLIKGRSLPFNGKLPGHPWRMQPSTGLCTALSKASHRVGPWIRNLQANAPSNLRSSPSNNVEGSIAQKGRNFWPSSLLPSM